MLYSGTKFWQHSIFMHHEIHLGVAGWQTFDWGPCHPPPLEPPLIRLIVTWKAGMGTPNFFISADFRLAVFFGGSNFFGDCGQIRQLRGLSKYIQFTFISTHTGKWRRMDHSPNRLASSEGWPPSGAESAYWVNFHNGLPWRWHQTLLILLLARLMGQYCFARGRLSSSVTLPAGKRRADGPGAWPVGRRRAGRVGGRHCTAGHALLTWCKIHPMKNTDMTFWHDIARPTNMNNHSPIAYKHIHYDLRWYACLWIFTAHCDYYYWPA